jgi:DNA helicase TIP49 (TBP-interacting protein)
MRTIIICGATATGKSDLAVSLAQEIGGEIVNADSMQVYSGMDIGTAKLSEVERGGVVHHLLEKLSMIFMRVEQTRSLLVGPVFTLRQLLTILIFQIPIHLFGHG